MEAPMTMQDFMSQYQHFFLHAKKYANHHQNSLAVIAGFITVFFLMMIYNAQNKKRLERLKVKNENYAATPKPTYTVTSQDIKAIAGDDIMTTQLDLARAYIEMDKKPLAKKILEHVIEHGEMNQKTAARELMSNL
jgi:FimV-like protein